MCRSWISREPDFLSTQNSEQSAVMAAGKVRGIDGSPHRLPLRFSTTDQTNAEHGPCPWEDDRFWGQTGVKQ